MKIMAIHRGKFAGQHGTIWHPMFNVIGLNMFEPHFLNDQAGRSRSDPASESDFEPSQPATMIQIIGA